MKHVRLQHQRLAMLSLAIALSACGGGGGGDSAPTPAPPPPPSAPTPAPPPPPPAPAPATPVAVSGVAATGAAFANADVTLKCQRGTASSTTDANGAFSVTVADGTLPCILRATAGGKSLHSLVETGTVLPATVNITPLTELLVAQAGQGRAAALFDSFDAAAQARLTTATVGAASTQVKAALSRIVDLSGDDLLRGTLVPSVNGAPGNLLDMKLDALARALTETSTTLETLSDALVAAPGTAATAFAAVPESAATCPALRSGNYGGFESENPELTEGPPAVIDAKALTASYDNGEITVNLQPVAGQPCRFTIANDTSPDEWVVSRAGLVLSTFLEDGKVKPIVFAPVHTIAASEYEGTWNYVGYAGALGQGRPVNGTFTLDAQGAVTGTSSHFVGSTPIASPLGQGSLKGVRAPNGQVFLMGNPAVGAPGMVFATKQSVLSAPTIGEEATYWEYTVTSAGGSALTTATARIRTVTGNSYTRDRTAVGTMPAWIETATFNSPRNGLRSRNSNACTDLAGAPSTCAGFVQMPMAALGVTVNAGVVNNGFFSIAVLRRP